MKLRPSPKNEMMLPPGGSLKFALLYRHYGIKWGRGGAVVSALDFTPEGRWFEANACHRVVSLHKELYPTLSLSTQVYNTAGGNPAMD